MIRNIREINRVQSDFVLTAILAGLLDGTSTLMPIKPPVVRPHPAERLLPEYSKQNNEDEEDEDADETETD